MIVVMNVVVVAPSVATAPDVAAVCSGNGSKRGGGAALAGLLGPLASPAIVAGS